MTQIERQRNIFVSRYLVAVASVAIVFVIRLALAPVLQERFPYILFTAAVILSSWYGGLWPGLLSGVLSIALAHYFFVDPYPPVVLSRTADGIGIVLFLSFTLAVNWAARRFRSAISRAEEDERRISEVLESITDNFIALDREWRFVYINRAAETVMQRRREDLLGKNVWAEYPRMNGSHIGNLYREVYRTRVPAHFEHFHRQANTWFEVNVYPSKQGGISVYFVDVTRRKRNEAEAARLAALVESSDDAIMSSSLEGIIESWNGGAIRLYGYSPEEAIGKSIYMLLPPDHQEEETDLLQRMRRGERLEHFETVRVCKDGRHIRISLSISPIRNPAGDIIGISGIARDVTARVELEEHLRESQKLESLGVLAGGVAHDFNNLLVAIMGNASLAMDRLPALDPGRRLLTEVRRASERASSLTRQLLAYAGRGRFVVELVDLSELVRETADLLRASAPRNVTLQLDLAGDLPAIEADLAQMHQIVMNLVINAAEAIGENNGWVRVETGVEMIDDQNPVPAFTRDKIRPGRYVTLRVEDNGSGMDEGTKARIFDPFFTTKFTGRGLGLSAVSGIVRAHGGMLDVSSRPGEGTVMKVWLPAASAQKPKPAPDTTRELNGRGNILLVDDEAVVRRTAQAALERYGYTVIPAEDGHQALELFARTPASISLVILDLAMPGMNGHETFRRLKEIRPEVPVLLSSGYNEVEAARQFQGQRVAGFLQKPYTAVQLAEKVKSVATG